MPDTRPRPPTPRPIAALFPPDREPTERRYYYDWHRRAPYPPTPSAYPPPTREVAALFHHVTPLDLLERSRAALRDGDDLGACLHADDAACFYDRFMHPTHRFDYKLRGFVEDHLGQILIAPFRRRLDRPYRFSDRPRHPTPPPPLCDLFENTLRARLDGKQPFVYRQPPTVSSPFERTLRARVRGKQPFAYHPPRDHDSNGYSLLVRITNPRRPPDPLSVLRKRYGTDRYAGLPF